MSVKLWLNQWLENPKELSSQPWFKRFKQMQAANSKLSEAYDQAVALVSNDLELQESLSPLPPEARERVYSLLAAGFSADILAIVDSFDGDDSDL